MAGSEQELSAMPRRYRGPNWAWPSRLPNNVRAPQGFPLEEGWGLFFLHGLPLSTLQEQMLQPSPVPGIELLIQAATPPFLANPPALDTFVLTPASLAVSRTLWAAVLILNH